MGAVLYLFVGPCPTEGFAHIYFLRRVRCAERAPGLRRVNCRLRIKIPVAGAGGALMVRVIMYCITLYHEGIA